MQGSERTVQGQDNEDGGESGGREGRTSEPIKDKSCVTRKLRLV